MNYKSFVDVLFILLLGTIVMLAYSVSVGAVDTDLMKLGGGGIAPISADEVEVVVIGHDELHHREARFGDVAQLSRALREDAIILLVVEDAQVRHRRVMEVWSDLAERGLEVHLGARPSAPEER